MKYFLSKVNKMIKQLLSGTVIGAFTAFIWGAISWAVLPWHNVDMLPLTSDYELKKQLKENAKEPGVYLLPKFDTANSHKQEIQEEWYNDAAKGPYAFMVIHPEGKDFNMESKLAVQFVNLLFVSLIMSFLLLKLSDTSVFKRAGSTTLMIFMGAFVAHIQYWNWWGFPLTYTLINIADLAFTWFLAAMAILQTWKRMRIY